MKLCIIPGDGIGGEVIHAAQQVLEALPMEITCVEATAGWGTFQEQGTALPDSTLETARHSDAVLFGAVASPSFAVEGYRSPIVALRKALELYANIRPTRNAGLPQMAGRGTVDMVVVRENTEGLYAGRERLEDDGATAIAERVITRQGTERIVQKACELAMERAEQFGFVPRLTLVHKANVLRVSDGLFRQVALEVVANYPSIQLEELLVDTAAMHVAQSPERFNVIVTSNLFGDILSDIACIHGGGLGLASSANLGKTYALFEPVHGAAPDIAGKGIANPLAALGCVVMLLAWDAQRDNGTTHAGIWAQRLQAVLSMTLGEGPYPPDMGGTATTQEVTDAVIARLKQTQ
jgi:homoisocitrate dehydrogenase